MAAILLVEHGADIYQIDRAITKFGMPMGPFRLADLVGFGVAVAIGTQFIENFTERTYKSLLIPMMQEDGRAGEATKKGFYIYDDKRRANPDPELKKYVEKSRNISGVAVDPKGRMWHLYNQFPEMHIMKKRLKTFKDDHYFDVRKQFASNMFTCDMDP